MEKTKEALEYFVYCIENHQKYGELYNYETFARLRFEVKGPGFVWIDASDFVKKYLELKSDLVQIDHKYVTLNESGVDADKSLYENLETISEYDPLSEYAIFVVVDRDKLPPAEALKIPEKWLYWVGRLKLTQVSRPSKTTVAQIKKRLNRMIQQGTQLLILDTSQPDFMGANLGKWLREIKELERRGKHIAVIINSDEKSAAKIPDDLKGDVLTIGFETPHKT